MLLYERCAEPILLPSLPLSRPPTRTLVGSHRFTTVSGGNRPLCHVGSRGAVDSASVINADAPTPSRQRDYRLTHPTTIQRRGHRYLRHASCDPASLDHRNQKSLDHRACAQQSQLFRKATRGVVGMLSAGRTGGYRTGGSGVHQEERSIYRKLDEESWKKKGTSSLDFGSDQRDI